MINRIITRLIQEHRYFRVGSDEESNSEEMSDVIFQNENEATQGTREHISKKQLMETMSRTKIKAHLAQQFVLDYFIKNELLEEAVLFANESSIDVSTIHEFNVQKISKEILWLFDSGKIDETILAIDKICPELLNKNPFLKFRIKCFKLREFKHMNFNNVQIFVVGELCSILLEEKNAMIKTELSEKFEEALGRFFMKGEFAVEKAVVLEEIRKDINSAFKIHDCSKIEEVVHLLAKMQKVVRKNAEVPMGNEENIYSISKLFLD